MLFNYINNPIMLLVVLPVVVISLSVHEFSHAFAAVRLGDNTPKMTGRYSLNPLAHMDWIGFLCMMITGFGWAKPVQVNPRNFKNYKWGFAATAVAGPVSNILLSFISVFILTLMVKTDCYVPMVAAGITGLTFKESLLAIISTMVMYFAVMNLYLAIFNLIPIPPLDGSRILSAALPGKASYYYNRYGRYFQYALIAIMIAMVYLDLFNPLGWLANEIYNLFIKFWFMVFGISY